MIKAAYRRRPLQPLLVWALLVSVAVHAITLPFMRITAFARGAPEAAAAPPIVSITPRRTPKPTPRPTLAPTPAATREASPVALRPKPVQRQAPSPRVAYHAAAPHLGVMRGLPATAGTGSTNETAPSSVGGIASSAPAADASQAPAPQAIAATPKPSCAQPSVAAAVEGAAVAPEFPAIARQQGASGSTAVRVTLDATGSVLDAQIDESSGSAVLDREALRAARATHYRPEVVNCAPSAGSYIFRADFVDQ